MIFWYYITNRQNEEKKNIVFHNRKKKTFLCLRNVRWHKELFQLDFKSDLVLIGLNLQWLFPQSDDWNVPQFLSLLYTLFLNRLNWMYSLNEEEKNLMLEYEKKRYIRTQFAKATTTTNSMKISFRIGLKSHSHRHIIINN